MYDYRGAGNSRGTTGIPNASLTSHLVVQSEDKNQMYAMVEAPWATQTRVTLAAVT